jgi:hypothetical protein
MSWQEPAAMIGAMLLVPVPFGLSLLAAVIEGFGRR